MNFYDLLDQYAYSNLDEDILEDIPDNFGIDLNFSGVKEKGVFTMGLHYHDSQGADFGVEASGKTTKELINNLDINLKKIEEDQEGPDYKELYDRYVKLYDEYESLKNDHEFLLETLYAAMGKR